MATCFVMDMTGPPHWSQSVPDGPQFGGKCGSIVQRTRRCLSNDVVEIRPAVLTAMFVAVAAITTQIRRKLRKQGDHVAGVLPSPKYDNIRFGHHTSP
jgi:hypothetical protein